MNLNREAALAVATLLGPNYKIRKYIPSWSANNYVVYTELEDGQFLIVHPNCIVLYENFAQFDDACDGALQDDVKELKTVANNSPKELLESN
jgi:hypothetical protein